MTQSWSSACDANRVEMSMLLVNSLAEAIASRIDDSGANRLAAKASPDTRIIRAYWEVRPLIQE